MVMSAPELALSEEGPGKVADTRLGTESRTQESRGKSAAAVKGAADEASVADEHPSLTSRIAKGAAVTAGVVAAGTAAVAGFLHLRKRSKPESKAARAKAKKAKAKAKAKAKR